MAKWNDFKLKKPKHEDTYIVAWKPKMANIQHEHFYAVWNYYFDLGFEIYGPALEWKDGIEIIAWRKLPKEYKGEMK